jgi:hypothetical protein
MSIRLNFPLLAETKRIEIGTAVIDVRCKEGIESYFGGFASLRSDGAR